MKFLTVSLILQSHGVDSVIVDVRGRVMFPRTQAGGGGVVVTLPTHEAGEIVPSTVQRGANVPTVV